MYQDWMANTPIFGEIKTTCLNCNKKIDMGYSYCPYCGKENIYAK